MLCALVTSIVALPRFFAAGEQQVVHIYESPEARSAGRPPIRNITEDRIDVLSPSPTKSVRSRADDVYNESKALDLAHFSQISYCSADKIRTWACSACALRPISNLSVFTDDTTDAQAYVLYDPGHDRIIVAFRGSSTLTNWILNFDFGKTSAYPLCDGCSVHSGFLTTWESVQDGVTNAAKALVKAHPTAEVFLTGHSMGGSLAALAAAHFDFSQNITVHGVYTYGESRTGNEAFKNFYNSGTHVSWRLTHYKDPVPHLPPMMFNFHHISTEVFYNDESTSYKLCDGSGEDPTFSNDVAWDSLLYSSDHCEYLNIPICNC